MTAKIHIKNGYLYVVLTYRVNGEVRRKWISTGIKEKGNKTALKLELDKYIDRYSYLETGETPEDVLFIEFLKKWHEKRKSEVELDTWEAYDIAVTKHIIPYFEEKALRLDEVTPKIVYEFYEYLSEHGNRVTGEGLSQASVKKNASALKLCFKSAAMLGLIESNPTADVSLPRSGRKHTSAKKVYMTLDEAKKLLKAFEGCRIYPIIYMTLFYGLRRSEIIGLRWENVDFENDTFEIKSTIVRHKTLIEKDSTKTEASNAEYELLPRFKAILKGLKYEQEENKALFGSGYNDTGYVFCWDNGNFYKPEYISHKFKEIIKTSGLPPMRFHDIRHSTASILFDMGWDIERIKAWLRHSDIKTTSDIYVHISRERKKLMAEELDDLFDF